MTAGAKEVVKTIFSGIDDSLYDEESAINLIEQCARDYALQIAEKAVGEITTGRTDMAYVVCDIYEQCGEEILSRIKTEIGGK